MISLGDRQFLAGLCLARAGLKVDPEKSYLIESRLAPVARREGFASPVEFLQALRHRPDERLTWSAVEAMALPETEFFRDRTVFDRLEHEVLPGLIAARDGGNIRVWSAGCATGQEVYSLAMMLADGPLPAERVELFASDLSERSLEKAQAGLYSQFEAQRGLPARTLVRHFEKRGDLFALSPRIRQMIRWRRVNLIDDLAPLGQFDLVLCRYVLGSLAPEARDRVMAALRSLIAPGGRLVLGCGEAAGSGLAAIDEDQGLFGLPGAAARSAA